MDIDKLRKRIDKAIEAVTAKGWDIQPSMWVSRNEKCCCPLGSVYLQEIGTPTPSSLAPLFAFNCDTEIPHILNMNQDEMYSIADGYDGQGYDNKKHVFKLWNLGRSYRSRYPYRSED